MFGAAGWGDESSSSAGGNIKRVRPRHERLLVQLAQIMISVQPATQNEAPIVTMNKFIPELRMPRIDGESTHVSARRHVRTERV